MTNNSLTLYLLHPAVSCTQRSPSPAWSWCPAESGIPWPASRCPPSSGWAHSPESWPWPGAGSTAGCSGTLSLPVGPPRQISVQEKKHRRRYENGVFHSGHVHVCMWGLTYQAELGLQLNLKRLQGPLELVDLTSGGLKGLWAGCHLLVQVVKLEDIKLKIKMVNELFRLFGNHLTSMSWYRIHLDFN